LNLIWAVRSRSGWKEKSNRSGCGRKEKRRGKEIWAGLEGEKEEREVFYF